MHYQGGVTIKNSDLPNRTVSFGFFRIFSDFFAHARSKWKTRTFKAKPKFKWFGSYLETVTASTHTSRFVNHQTSTLSAFQQNIFFWCAQKGKIFFDILYTVRCTVRNNSSYKFWNLPRKWQFFIHSSSHHTRGQHNLLTTVKQPASIKGPISNANNDKLW